MLFGCGVMALLGRWAWLYHYSSSHNDLGILVPIFHGLYTFRHSMHISLFVTCSHTSEQPYGDPKKRKTGTLLAHQFGIDGSKYGADLSKLPWLQVPLAHQHTHWLKPYPYPVLTVVGLIPSTAINARLIQEDSSQLRWFWYHYPIQRWCPFWTAPSKLEGQHGILGIHPAKEWCSYSISRKIRHPRTAVPILLSRAPPKSKRPRVWCLDRTRRSSGEI